MNTLPHEIWDMKYRFKEPDGTPIDVSLADSWARVALAAAKAEAPSQQSEWAQAFAGALAGHRFLPA